MLRVRILLILSWIVFFLKNWRHFDFYEHFIKKFHIRKVKCLVRGGCQFGGWNQVTTVLSDIKSLHLTHEYWLSAQQLTQQMVGEYFTFFQNYTRRKLSIAHNQTLFFDQFNQTKVQWLRGKIGYYSIWALHASLFSCEDARLEY